MSKPISKSDSSMSLFGPQKFKLSPDVRVLLVEDSTSQAKVMVHRLKLVANMIGENWSITTVPEAESALELIDKQEEKLDIIFVDQNLSLAGLQGDELIYLLRAHKSMQDSIVIMCTGNVAKYCSRANRSGADSVWEKPLPAVDEIVRRLQRFKYRRQTKSLWEQRIKVNTVEDLLTYGVTKSKAVKKSLSFADAGAVLERNSNTHSESHLMEVVHIMILEPDSDERLRIVSVLEAVAAHLKQNWHICTAKDTVDALRQLEKSLFVFSIFFVSYDNSLTSKTYGSFVSYIRRNPVLRDSIVLGVLSDQADYYAGFDLVSYGVDNLWLKPLTNPKILAARLKKFSYLRNFQS